jgi:hypothetical protein
MIGIIISVVLVGYAVGVQAFHASTAADVIERVINDSQVKPFRLAEAYSSGPDTLVVDQAALVQFIDSASAAGVSGLVQALGNTYIGTDDIGLEASFMVLGIDPTTGAVTGVQTYQTRTSGGLGIEPSKGSMAALQAVAASTTQPSDFAVLAGASHGGARYLRYAVVAAIALRISEETVEQRILSLTGLGADLYQRKVVSLRGDVS